MKNILLLLLALLTLACTSSVNSQPETEKPTNIIFLIGDGMGLSAVST
ncbi:MAG: alkaline phosphatase, partial [Bacteroidetes bacterium]